MRLFLNSASKSILLVMLCSPAISFAADTIAGKVYNRTTNQPAAGDEVVLLRLGEGMEEAARTRTDAQGAFSLPVAAPGAQYIVQVVHEGVHYDQKVTSAAPLEIAVFNAVPRIPGMSGSMGIVEMSAAGESLKITEMYSITNASQPPVTQSGPRNFEFSLPKKAKLDSFETKRAGSIWVNVAPVAVPGQTGRYHVDFPLRPGDTLFKYKYSVPYAGATTLRLKLAYPIKSFAVGHPPSMKFKAQQAQSFKSLGLVQGLELEAAATPLAAGNVPVFEISGLGTPMVPAETAAVVPAPPVQRPPFGNHIGADRSAQRPAADRAGGELWAIGAAGAAVFVAILFVFVRKSSLAAAAVQKSGPESVVAALQEELSQLEKEKSHGAISPEQYDSTKQALNLSIRRALARKAS
jgi:hypothetical protein